MPRRDAPRIAVVVGYVFLAAAFTWPLPLALGSAFTGDPAGDTGVYVWNQWVFHHELINHRRNPLVTDHILSLTPPVDLSQHNYTVFLNLLALPLLPWLGVVATFNVVFLSVTVITALSAYALVRGVTQATRAEAWLAGAAFAWSPVLVARSTSHFSLVAAAPLPLFLLCVIRADRSRRSRDAVLAGLCMAWAAFCDVYYAIYCLMITGGYVGVRVLRLGRQPQPAAPILRWVLDVLILAVAGLIVGLLLGRGGRLAVLGVSISVRGLYTPVLVMTVLVVVRALLSWRPRLNAPLWSPTAARAMIIGIVACAGPLTPILYGLGQRVGDGRLAQPDTFWRSSPRGVDLLALFEFNPNHQLARLFDDRQASAVATLAEYTACFSLAALAVIAFAVWRAGYRPRIGWVLLTAGFAALALGPFVQVAGMNTHVPGPWTFLRYLPVISLARMPTRFAVVAALGAAVMLAGALAAIGRRHPERRTAITWAVALVVLFELVPAPRTLYSARIPSVFDIIAGDPRPGRVLQLPFGVRDGVSSNGNFNAGYQYYQTYHGRQLIGGYLSRISKRRVGEVRAQPTLNALMTLSEGGTLTTEQTEVVVQRGPRFITRNQVLYVLINLALASPALIEVAHEAWQLEEIARDGLMVLYVPKVEQARDP